MTNMHNPAYQRAAWPEPVAPQIKTYMVPAILVTMFCFWPTGIAAIVFASQVSSRLSAGDYQGAIHASKQARRWTIVSLAVFVALAVIAAVAAAVLIATSSSTPR